MIPSILTVDSTSIVKIPVEQIVVDGGTQSRSRLYDDTVSEYAEDMLLGDVFPPVIVFFDGAQYWLADGFHRVAAAKQAQFTEILAKVNQGNQRDAILFSTGANAEHGLRRTNSDKRRAVIRLLRDPEWSKWSHEEIARQAVVSPAFIRKIINQITELPNIDSIDPIAKFGVESDDLRKVRDALLSACNSISPGYKLARGKDGVPYPIKVSNIGEQQQDLAQKRLDQRELQSTFPFLDISPSSFTPVVEPIRSSPNVPRQRPKKSTAPAKHIDTEDTESGQLWRLGHSHLLYCGDPSDRKFQKILPEQIALLLNFPSEFSQIPKQIFKLAPKTLLSFHTDFDQDFHLDCLRIAIKGIAEGATDAGDNVVLYFLPDPALFLLFEQLECPCFCADPDPVRCKTAIAAWEIINKSVTEL